MVLRLIVLKHPHIHSFAQVEFAYGLVFLIQIRVINMDFKNIKPNDTQENNVSLPFKRYGFATTLYISINTLIKLLFAICKCDSCSGRGAP